MPNIEGFGIERRVVEHKSQTKDQFFLTRKEESFTSSSEEVYPFKDLSDLVDLTAFVDRQITKEAASPFEAPALELSGAEECIGYGD